MDFVFVFFPRFQPLKLDLLEIKLHFYFYFLAMKLSNLMTEVISLTS